jgi:hypothetical protein
MLLISKGNPLHVKLDYAKGEGGNFLSGGAVSNQATSVVGGPNTL